MNPLQVSQQGPYGKRYPLTGHFAYLLKTSYKFLEIRRPQESSAPPSSPKVGPLWKQTPISEHYLTYLSGSQVKEPFLQVPFMESLTERCPIPRALLHSSFKVPG